MTVNYHGILTLEIIGFFTMVIYHEKLSQQFYNIGPLSKKLATICSRATCQPKMPHSDEMPRRIKVMVPFEPEVILNGLDFREKKFFSTSMITPTNLFTSVTTYLGW
jgi:hypothetical protein